MNEYKKCEKKYKLVRKSNQKHYQNIKIFLEFYGKYQFKVFQVSPFGKSKEIQMFEVFLKTGILIYLKFIF